MTTLNHDVSSEESSDEEDLALDGELVRRPDRDADETAAPTTKKARTDLNDDDADDDDDDDDDDEDVPMDRIDVEFVFCDMDERFFHGICNFLSYYKALVRPSMLADCIVDHVGSCTVGTVISTEADQADENDVSSKGNIYGFASIVLRTTRSINGQDQKRDDTAVTDAAVACISTLLDYCQKNVPKDNKQTTTKPYFDSAANNIGIQLHARMMNLPLELVPVLHQQLLLDLDFAIEHYEEITDRDFRSLSHLICVVPCDREASFVTYKFFEDEYLADAADAVYDLDNSSLRVILISLAAYRKVVADLARMFPSG